MRNHQTQQHGAAAQLQVIKLVDTTQSKPCAATLARSSLRNALLVPQPHQALLDVAKGSVKQHSSCTLVQHALLQIESLHTQALQLCMWGEEERDASANGCADVALQRACQVCIKRGAPQLPAPQK